MADPVILMTACIDLNGMFHTAMQDPEIRALIS